MSGGSPPDRSGSKRGLVAATIVVLVVFGASFGLMFGIAHDERARVIQPRPFTLEVKRELLAELEAAQVEQRKHGDSQAAMAHVQRALALAVGHGQIRIFGYLRLTFSSGCAAAQHYYGFIRALELARQAPTVPAVKRRVTRPTTRAGTT